MNTGPNHSHDKRIEKLEFVVAHLQETVDDLSQLIIDQQKQMDSLARQLVQAKQDIRTALATDANPRTLADDKPPHY